MAFHRLETKNGFCSIENRRSNGIYPTPNHDNITHLSRHKISELARGRMVDWMFEVLNAFKMSEQTFFLAVQYMDRFLENTPNVIQQNDLHLLGVTSMFIASKLEDVTPIYLETMVRKVCHNRLTHSQILQLERVIIKTL
ncbi:MAG: cyclin family protein [bacterium]|jgi:hypothetical protein